MTKAERDEMHVAKATFPGAFGEPYQFTPTRLPYIQIERRTDIDRGQTTIVNEMIDVFTGRARSSRPYLQLPRMGRTCFIPAPGGFVAAKGSLGRSPASESVRNLLDMRWNSMYGDGAGCTRIEVDKEKGIYFLANYRRLGDNEIEIFQYQTEGYGIFIDLLKEYIFMREAYEVDIESDFRTIDEPPALKFVLDNRLAINLGWTKPDKPFNHYASHYCK